MPSRSYRTGRGPLRGLLWPDVRVSHPNYAMVILGELVVHFGLAYTSFFGAHQSPIWKYFGGSTGLVINGMVHLTIGCMMLFGLYWRFTLTRLGLLVSVSTYLIQLTLFVAALIEVNTDLLAPKLSYEGSVYTVGLILLSIAAYKEPLVPGLYAHKEENGEYHRSPRSAADVDRDPHRSDGT